MFSKLNIFGLVALAFAWYTIPPSAKPGKLVKTDYGKTEGTISISRGGREFYEWLGLPYAYPPVGSLRFQPPEYLPYWRVDVWGIVYAKYYRFPCPANYDGKIIGSEDCLHLNIHVPKLDKEPGRNRPLLPVMIYIHGGAFVEGSGSAFRPDYFMDEDVVLVTLNYRLGVFGFLSSGDNVIRGNMGLKDQVMAISWVHDNIAAFGGDKKQITLFGNNAGAASIHYHLLSPLTKGLFQRAIIISGAATAPWSFAHPDRLVERTKDIAATLKCPQEDSEMLAACLKNKTVSDLLGVAKEELRDMFKPDLMGKLIGPTIEPVLDVEDEDYSVDTYLTHHPYAVLNNSTFRRVHLLAGVTNNEASYAIEALLSDSGQQTEEDLASKLTEAIRRFCSHSNGTQPDDLISEKIKDYYLANQQGMSLEEKLKKYGELLSDCLSHRHVSGAADFQRFHSMTHLFYFNVSGVSIETEVEWSDCISKIITYPLILMGSLPKLLGVEAFLGRGPTPRVNVLDHGVDLPFLFPISSVPRIDKEHAMYNFSVSWVKFLVDFASRTSSKVPLKFGDVSVTRLPVKGPMTYLEVSPEPKLIEEPFQTRLDFLKSIGIF